MSTASEPEPLIIILDDDNLSRESAAIQLLGFGRFIPFDDPRPALDYLRQNSVDVVIVDIRMPNLPVDGLFFLRELRSFDNTTAVIVRTGDENMNIAEAAIDAHATQRVIKLRPDATAKLREAVVRGIQETRERRHLISTAAAAEKSQHQLLDTLARIDTDLTTAALTRALLTEITNHATALAGYADALAEPLRAHPKLAVISAKNQTEASRLIDKINDFLGNPFVDTRFAGNAAASVNAVVAALAHYFREHPILLDRELRLTTRETLPDLYFTANPPKLLTALRHLIEYVALHSEVGTSISLSISTSPNAAQAVKTAQHGFTLNAKHAPSGPAAVFMIAAHCDYSELPLTTDHNRSSDNPRNANLLIVATALLDDNLTFAAIPSNGTQTLFQIYVPLSQ